MVPPIPFYIDGAFKPSRTVVWQMCRPSPLPPCPSFVVNKGSKMRDGVSGAMPIDDTDLILDSPCLLGYLAPRPW